MIRNLAHYNQEMTKTINDKLFFLEHIENVDTIVDFGCADGSLMCEMIRQYPETQHKHIIFFDNNPDMLELADFNLQKSLNPNKGHNLSFLSNYSEVKKDIKGRKSLLILSSVIHEVISYSKNKHDIEEFFEFVFNSGFKYIAIRDMATSKLSQICHTYKDMGTRVMSYFHESSIGKAMLHSFQDEIGKTVFNDLSDADINHLLLKSNFVDNWTREVKENYFAHTIDELQIRIANSKYSILYYEQFVLPYLREWVMRILGIEIRHTTHVKCVLRKI